MQQLQRMFAPNFLRFVPAFCWLLVFLVSGCQTVDTAALARKEAAASVIRNERPGGYYVGRRFFKQDYKMWGWVREPGQPWNSARLVMLNEQRKLAPDRERNKLGSDHNFEYHLTGFFSGEQVYEPASNRFYPEFVLLGYTLVSESPPMIFADPRSLDPAFRLLTPPE